MGKMQAQDIEEVIEIMDYIVDRSIQNGDRIGYFASLYRTVTVVVRDRCDEGYFEDNERMRRLDTIFANRYFEALEAYWNGEAPTGSWGVSFALSKNPRLIILQHLLMGMNAHISLDLGVAAAIVDDRILGSSLKRDFDRLNTILAGLIDTVESQMIALSPAIGTLERLAVSNIDESIVSFSINIARDQAWKFAHQLAVLPEDEFDELIAERDTVVAGYGKTIGVTHWYIRPLIWLIALRETKDIRKVVSILSDKSWMTTINYHVNELIAEAQAMGIDLDKILKKSQSAVVKVSENDH
jgi:hypothetical protein